MSEFEEDVPTTPRTLVTGLATLVVGLSASSTAGAILNNALPVAKTRSQKIQFAIGAFSLAGAAGKWASDHAKHEIDEVFASVDRVKYVLSNKNDDEEETTESL